MARGCSVFLLSTSTDRYATNAWKRASQRAGLLEVTGAPCREAMGFICEEGKAAVDGLSTPVHLLQVLVVPGGSLLIISRISVILIEVGPQRILTSSI